MGTSRLEYPEDMRKRSWEHVDSLPYPDSEESEDDIVDTDECENELALNNLRNEVTHPIMVDTCGELCAQLDDFNWVRPTEEWNEESGMPESEIDTPHIGDGLFEHFGLVFTRDGNDETAVVRRPGGRSDET